MPTRVFCAGAPSYPRLGPTRQLPLPSSGHVARIGRRSTPLRCWNLVWRGARAGYRSIHNPQRRAGGISGRWYFALNSLLRARGSLLFDISHIAPVCTTFFTNACLLFTIRTMTIWTNLLVCCFRSPGTPVSGAHRTT